MKRNKNVSRPDRTPDDQPIVILHEFDDETNATVLDCHFDNQDVYRQLALAWYDMPIALATYDPNLGSLTLRANDVTARLAVRDEGTALQVVALVRMETATLRALKTSGQLAVIVSSPNWEYFLRPDGALIVD
jgi:hypothetical protein